MPPDTPHPVRVRTRRSRTARRAMAAGIAAVAAAAALFAAVTVVSGSGEVEVRLGDERFVVGRVDALAEEIAERGPFLVADASPRRERDIYVNHGGGAVLSSAQWVAFAARPAGAARECFLRWDAKRRRFTDPCSGATYPPDGEGLTQYRTEVVDGTLYVDLRERDRSPPKSASS